MFNLLPMAWLFLHNSTDAPKLQEKPCGTLRIERNVSGKGMWDNLVRKGTCLHGI